MFNSYDEYSRIHTTGLIYWVFASRNGEISENKLLFVSEMIYYLAKFLKEKNVDEEYVRNVIFECIYPYWIKLGSNGFAFELIRIAKWQTSQSWWSNSIRQMIIEDLVAICNIDGDMNEDEKEMIEIVTKLFK